MQLRVSFKNKKKLTIVVLRRNFNLIKTTTTKNASFRN